MHLLGLPARLKFAVTIQLILSAGKKGGNHETETVKLTCEMEASSKCNVLGGFEILKFGN